MSTSWKTASVSRTVIANESAHRSSASRLRPSQRQGRTCGSSRTGVTRSSGALKSDSGGGAATANATRPPHLGLGGKRQRARSIVRFERAVALEPAKVFRVQTLPMIAAKSHLRASDTISAAMLRMRTA